MSTKNIVTLVAAVIIIASLSFYIGTKTGGNKNPNRSFGNGNFPGQMRGNGQNNGQRFGGMVAGEIMAKDDTSITVKLSNGGSRIVFFSPSTSVTKTASSSPSELTLNQQVVVNGSANPDGSINAQTIQLGGNFFRNR